MAREPGFSPRTGTPSEHTKLVQKRILELKRDGLSFGDISKEMGLSDTYVKKMYKTALKLIIVDSVDECRKMELLRLERAEKKIIEIMDRFAPMVSSGSVVYDTVLDEQGNIVLNESQEPVTVKLADAAPQLAAVDRYLRILERRARLLGLDMPNKVAMTDPSGQNEAQVVQVYLPENDR